MTIDRPETWKEKNRRAATNVMGHFLMRAGDNSSRHSSSSAPTRRVGETVRGVSSNFKLLFRLLLLCTHLPSFFSSLKQRLDVSFLVIEKVLKNVSIKFYYFESLKRSKRIKNEFFHYELRNGQYFEYLNLRVSLWGEIFKKGNLTEMFLFTKERKRKQSLIRNLNSLSFGIKFRELVADERMKLFIS